MPSNFSDYALPIKETEQNLPLRLADKRCVGALQQLLTTSRSVLLRREKAGQKGGPWAVGQFG